MQEIMLVAQDTDGNPVLLTAYQEETIGRMLGRGSDSENGSPTSQWLVRVPEHSPFDD